MSKKDLLKKMKYFLKFLPDKLYLQVYFFLSHGYFINFNNPKTFNEKLNWLKIYDRNPQYSKMVDKYEAKKYVEKIIGKEYIIPNYFVWNNIEDIDFDKLPNQFVLKCTHDSGGIVIVKNKKKANYESIKKELKKSFKYNYYYIGREYPYKNIKPRIIAEKIMIDETNGDLKDYKFMCFNGKVKCSFVCSNRDYKGKLNVDFFDLNWNKLPFTRKYGNSNENVPKPHNYKKMITLAEKIAKNIPFVRIDFYEINNQIYFGEITFYPGCGFEKFNPREWDKKLGKWLILPSRREDKI